jgi:hypothetical protein
VVLDNRSEEVGPMSAFVTYDIRTFDADGLQLPTLAVRAVSAPKLDDALTYAYSENNSVCAVEVVRSVPSRISHMPEVTRRVAARVRIAA